MENSNRFRGALRWGGGVVLLLIAIGTASTLTRVSGRNAARAVAEELRAELQEVRAELDACLSTRSGMEIRFDALDRDVAALREEADVLESIDPRGVPEENYPRYMSVVEEYNRLVLQWEREAEELRTQAETCRALAEAHNLRADSLRTVLVEAGLWEEDENEGG